MRLRVHDADAGMMGYGLYIFLLWKPNEHRTAAKRELGEMENAKKLCSKAIELETLLTELVKAM